MAYPVNQAMYPPAMGVQLPPTYNPVPGFEGYMPGGGFLPPPPVQPLPAPDTQPLLNLSIPALTEEDAREAFSDYVSSNCCYSDGPVTDGVITNMEHFNTFRYRLETYTESRKTDWATKPFDGQPLNTCTQPPPGLWEIPVNPPSMFTDSTQEVEVPSTASLKPCDTCTATGRCKCANCNGSGHRRCQTCHGSGNAAEEQTCEQCNGSGKQRCGKCSGQGTVQCDSCKGKRQVVSYIKLTVEWKNNTEVYATEQSSGLKVEKIEKVSGKQLFKDTKFMVYPLMGFPNQDVFQASERLIKKHHQKYSQSGRILQQRHSVELVPITKVSYKWEDNSYIYYVYGIESKVRAEDYPATCCCVIL